MTFGLAQIDNQTNGCLCAGIGVEQAQTARFDHAFDGFGTGRHDFVPLQGQAGAVIGHQLRAIGHQRQCQRRFACPCRTHDQDAGRPRRNAACMQRQAWRLRHGSDRKADNETGAQRVRGGIGIGRANILGPDNPAMRFNDLL